MGLKIAVTGKGGVGKTTLSAMLAQAYAERGNRVLAIDADPSPCLGPALAFPPELLRQIHPIAEMEELIAERTGAEPGKFGGYFKLNPRVDDLPEEFSTEHGGIRLLELGAVEMGGSGCICPESTILRALITHVLLYRDEVVILDLYAGVEHLGRATADAVDAMLIVVEPTRRSLATAHQISKLARDLGLEQLFLVGNKVRGPDDEAFIKAEAVELPLLGILNQDEAVMGADRRGETVYSAVPRLRRSVLGMLDTLEEAIRV
jgi:CO dehydrogenase maturation factor